MSAVRSARGRLQRALGRGPLMLGLAALPLLSGADAQGPGTPGARSAGPTAVAAAPAEPDARPEPVPPPPVSAPALDPGAPEVPATPADPAADLSTTASAQAAAPAEVDGDPEEEELPLDARPVAAPDPDADPRPVRAIIPPRRPPPVPVRPVPRGRDGQERTSLRVFGALVEPAQRRQLTLGTSESFVGAEVAVPVSVIRGRYKGPVLCLTAGIHGDELNGVEIARSILEDADPAELHGTLIGVPIVNMPGFRRSSRYLPDRRDLNRYFPGNPHGSSASRIAHALFSELARHCQALVDFHSGSFHRTNLPQVRADLRIPAVLELARSFGTAVAVHNAGRPGTLRRAATDAGIPAVTFEAGEPMRFQRREIMRGIIGTRGMLSTLGIVRTGQHTRSEGDTYFRSSWVRVDDGGILISRVQLGDFVTPGEILATVTDPVTNERAFVRAPLGGRVIGMAVDQVVMPGFAAFHVATPGRVIPTTELGDEVDADDLESVDAGPEYSDSADPDLELEERPE